MRQTLAHADKSRYIVMVAVLVILVILEIVASAQQVKPVEEGNVNVKSTQQSKLGIVPSYRQAEKVYVITIDGVIDQVTVMSIKRRLKYAENDGVDAVVFEISTPGGLAMSALEICEIIKTTSIPLTVAWVHSNAISAGTLISLACDEIVMAPYSRLGDCAPIKMTGNLSLAERAKAESPLLAEAVDSARRHGYDEKLVRAFIAVDIELWLIENKTTGDRLFVDRIEYERIFGEQPPESIRKQASSGGSGGGRVLPFIKTPLPTGEQLSGDYVPSDEERERDIEMQQVLPSLRPDLTETDRDQYRLLEVTVDDKTILLVMAEQAQLYGLSKGVVGNDADLKAYFGAKELVRFNRSWSESLVRILTSSVIRIGLILIFAIGLIWEMASPGFGVPGGIAAIALVILLGAPALAGLAQWWDIALVLIGILLLAIEMLIIPGFGVAGVSGFICLAVGFVGTFVAPDPSGSLFPTSDAARDAMLRGLGVLMTGSFGTVIVGYFASKYLGSIPILSKLMLTTTMKDIDPQHSLIEAMGSGKRDYPRTGDIGLALTELHPIGRAAFDGDIFDVVANHGIIAVNSRVRVIKSSKFRIVVEVVPNG